MLIIYICRCDMMVIYMKRCFRIDLDIIVIQKSLTQFLKWFNENYIKYLY